MSFFPVERVRLLLLISFILNIIGFSLLIKEMYFRHPEKLKATDAATPSKVKEVLEAHVKELKKTYSKFPVEEDNTVFIGTSVTEGFNVTELFGNIKNRGIAGDNSARLLERLPLTLKNKPGKIFIEVGVNDIGYWKFSNDSLLHNYKLIIETIKAESPDTKIYFQNMLPSTEDNKIIPFCAHKNKDILFINQQLQSLCKQNSIEFIDLYSGFVLNGEMNPRYTIDGIHLNEDGYTVWAKLIRPYLQ